MAKPIQESFEALYRQLEAAVSRLEAGGLSLEEGLALYEEGVGIAQRLQEMLAAARLRIARLGEEPQAAMGWLDEGRAEGPGGPGVIEGPALREEGPAWEIEGEELDQG